MHLKILRKIGRLEKALIFCVTPEMSEEAALEWLKKALPEKLG
jgi:hypothetical protein